MHVSKVRRRMQSGLTMIEVLITLVIVSFGLLGVGALQLMSLQVNQGANQRTQAAMLATSVLDAVRGNRPNAERYARTFGAGVPSASSTVVWDAEMGAIVGQVQRALPAGDLQVVVTRFTTDNGKPFFDVNVTVRWSESGRLMDRNQVAPDTYTEYNLRTNV